MAHYVNGILVPDEQPVAQQPESQSSALPTAGQTARYNLFRATPTPQQAAVVNAATMQPEATPQPKPVTTPQANKPAGTVDNLSGTGFASQGNGQQQPITSMDDLAKAMGYTSPEEEDRLRKASVANQRMLAVVDALRHIGNIAHTVNYAPSQQFNSPVMEERQRYLQGKAMRDRANQTYLTYQQAKAKQDREAEKMERDYQLKAADDKRKEALNDARISRMYAQNENDGARKVYWDTRARLLEEGWPLEKALKEARAAQAQAAANLSNIKANQGGFAPKTGSRGRGGGSARDFETTITYDANQYDPNSGKLIKRGTQHTTRTYKTNGRGGSGNGNAFKNFSIRK